MRRGKGRGGECTGVCRSGECSPPLLGISSSSPYCSGEAEGAGKEGHEDGEIDVAGGRHANHVASDFKEKKTDTNVFPSRKKR